MVLDYAVMSPLHGELNQNMKSYPNIIIMIVIILLSFQLLFPYVVCRQTKTAKLLK